MAILTINFWTKGEWKIVEIKNIHHCNLVQWRGVGGVALFGSALWGGVSKKNKKL